MRQHEQAFVWSRPQQVSYQKYSTSRRFGNTGPWECPNWYSTSERFCILNGKHTNSKITEEAKTDHDHQQTLAELRFDAVQWMSGWTKWQQLSWIFFKTIFHKNKQAAPEKPQPTGYKPAERSSRVTFLAPHTSVHTVKKLGLFSHLKTPQADHYTPLLSLKWSLTVMMCNTATFTAAAATGGTFSWSLISRGIMSMDGSMLIWDNFIFFDKCSSWCNPHILFRLGPGTRRSLTWDLLKVGL